MPLSPMVARRYAASLFQLSADKASTVYFGKGQQILNELRAFSEGMLKVADGVEFFLSPVISRDDKKAALAELESKLPLTHRFLAVLVEANRMEALSEIIAEFQAALDQASGELSVDVELAHAATPALLDEIKGVLHGEWKRQIKLNTTVNPNLIGGFIAKAPGRIMDASVSSQLEALEQEMMAAS